MDEFIQNQFKMNEHKKPSEYYTEFTEKYEELIANEMKSLKDVVYCRPDNERMDTVKQNGDKKKRKSKKDRQSMDKCNSEDENNEESSFGVMERTQGTTLSSDEISIKLKKTFKNRYFVLLRGPEKKSKSKKVKV